MDKVVITDYTFDEINIEKDILESLGCEVVAQKTHTGEDDMIGLVRDADFVINQFAPITARVIDSMTRCRVISRYGIGFDSVDVDAAAARSIPVCNIPDFCVDEVADHTIALILCLTRQIEQLHQQCRDGNWFARDRVPRMNCLREMTVGLVGFGRIGMAVVDRLHGFKCRIIAHDPVVDDSLINQQGCNAVPLDQLLQESDIVSLHCPSTSQNQHMINEDTLSRMKEGVLFINVSRGSLVQTEDLIYALQQGHIGGAALDTTDPEPPPEDSPLWRLDNVIITPHKAGATPRSIRELQTRVTEPILRIRKGQPLKHVVNGVKS